ncbi:two-component system KDP operon response regulator KdpE [Luteibacter sp. Sphag1AF]|uniref:response regulator n=1 Tax=Luteibacter sp. Sphag1AF TaxID=2587031 RepID=UPI00161CFA90|nr:response regulator [Luteibacter sp. Sphag1AF]MBB3228685.1 two-component system KDP operon response regulator KdpE [Luteibacter sp. Sphag1AF]
MSKPRILIVEDEADIRHFIRLSLEREGMTVHEADSAMRARIDAASRQPQLVIVDLGLPDGDGKTFIRELRGWSNAPVLVLSARDHEQEKVEALEAGADDYLVKPFGVPELIARVRAQLRRASIVAVDGTGASAMAFGDVRVDLATYEVTRAGQPVHLTPIEFRLLAALMRGHGKVLTYRQLLLDVWGPGHAERPHYVRVYMTNLRQKLEDEPARPRHLITELQVGYRLAGLNRGG